MALFGKKKPAEFCAICGKERKTGLLRGLFQIEVEGQYVCSDCYSFVDVDTAIRVEFTMEQLKAYFAYYQQNQKLKEVFTATSTIELGNWGPKVLLDRNNGLMSFDPNFKELFYHKGCLQSFAIKEDDCTIFEGSPEGLVRYESNVREQISQLRSDYRFFLAERRRFDEKLRRMSPEQREAQEDNRPRFTACEPFRKFYVELYLDHPYWTKKELSMEAPKFDTDDPDITLYASEYQEQFETIELLAQELMAFAFSQADGGATAGAEAMDAADALVRFKELLDKGVITEEEFAAKKQQLLGL